MRVLLRFAAILGGLAAVAAGAMPAEAGCVGKIINRSRLTAVVSRDGGPFLRIPPHSSRAIPYHHPGTLDIALVCGRTSRHEPPDAQTLFRAHFTYTAIIDRCYVDVGNGFFENEFGPSLFGAIGTAPLTLNVPRQGDVVIGPVTEERCWGHATTTETD